MMGLQGVGGAVGGTTGASMMKMGLWGEIATLVATGVAAAVEYNTAVTEKNAEAKAKMKASAEFQRQADLYEKGTSYADTFSPGATVVGPDKSKAAYYRELARKERIKERASEMFDQPYSTSQGLLSKYLTPKERAQTEAQALREQARSDLKAATGMRGAAGALRGDDRWMASMYTGKASKLESEAVTLQKKANELLSSIDKNTSKGWGDWALEAIGGGSRTSRPLALSEIQGAGMRGTAINLAVHNNPGASPREIADIISAALRAHGLN